MYIVHANSEYFAHLYVVRVSWSFPSLDFIMHSWLTQCLQITLVHIICTVYTYTIFSHAYTCSLPCYKCGCGIVPIPESHGHIYTCTHLLLLLLLLLYEGWYSRKKDLSFVERFYQTLYQHSCVSGLSLVSYILLPPPFYVVVQTVYCCLSITLCPCAELNMWWLESYTNTICVHVRPTA